MTDDGRQINLRKWLNFVGKNRFVLVMSQERSNEEAAKSVPEELGSEWVKFIQQQRQVVFETAIPHIVQQISERAVSQLDLVSTSNHTRSRSEGRDGEDFEGRDSKVATLDKFTRKIQRKKGKCINGSRNFV